MKWNQDLRRIIYKELKNRFGPVSDWKRMTNPSGNRQEYSKFLRDMATALQLLTGNKCTPGAVEQQLMWGTQRTQKECKNSGHVSVFILNRAVALEVGLIQTKDLPDHAIFKHDLSRRKYGVSLK